MADCTTRCCALRWLGRVDYASALELQLQLAAGRKQGLVPDHLLLLEHPAIYTLGVRADPANVLVSPASVGAALARTDRGGDVTFHGPGQLVGYPVLNLNPDRRDVKRYVTDLEEILIRTLSGFGISARRSTIKERVSSLWVGNDKIAAIGIHISRWVTTHGFALNVTDEPLPFFGGIVRAASPTGASPVSSACSAGRSRSRTSPA